MKRRSAVAQWLRVTDERHIHEVENLAGVNARQCEHAYGTRRRVAMMKHLGQTVVANGFVRLRCAGERYFRREVSEPVIYSPVC